MLYQLGALDGLAQASGSAIAYVKPHGALYNALVAHGDQARAVVDAVRSYDPTLPVLGLPGSVFLREAQDAGLRAVTEAFADRAYTPTGELVSRRVGGAVLTDPSVVAERVLRLVRDGTVEAIDGSTIRIDAESVCVHGDSPGAVDMAHTVRKILFDNDIDIASFIR